METCYNVKLKNGDRVTEGTLSLFLMENKPLVYNVFSKFYGGYTREKEDLVQIGWVALWEAVKRYDGESSVFGTFATICVKNAMYKYVVNYCKHNPEIQMDGEIIKNEGYEPDIEQQLDIKMALEKTGSRMAQKVVEGKRVVDIAEEEGVSRKMIYIRLKKERVKIREKLAEKAL